MVQRERPTSREIAIYPACFLFTRTQGDLVYLFVNSNLTARPPVSGPNLGFGLGRGDKFYDLISSKKKKKCFVVFSSFFLLVAGFRDLGLAVLEREWTASPNLLTPESTDHLATI